MPTSFALHLEKYEGPLEKLLELIEGKKLEITELNLSEVTSDFLNYVDALKKEATADEAYTSLLADFLVVASRLLLIKSKSLLPQLILNEDEESDIKDLERRLKLYQELKGTNVFIKEQWSQFPQLLARDYLAFTSPVFYPPQKLELADMTRSIQKMLGELEHFLAPKSIVRDEIINLKSKIQEILSRITSAPTKMRSFHQGKRGELVVLFLAILHLIKEQLLDVEQAEHFSDIMVQRRKEE